MANATTVQVYRHGHGDDHGVKRSRRTKRSASPVVSLALRGDEGEAGCVRPVPLALIAKKPEAGIRLCLTSDDGYESPSRDGLGVTTRVAGTISASPQPRAF